MERKEAIERLKQLRLDYTEFWEEIKNETTEALDIAIASLKTDEAYQLEYESNTKNDLALIHTDGLDEGIRCAMCTNSIKSDRGCDGGCVVNNAMYKEVMDVIENHIVDTDKMVEPTTKNDLGVDWDELKRKILMEVDGGTDDAWLAFGEVCNRISNSIDEFVADMREGVEECQEKKQ